MRSYLLKIDGKVAERPQHMLMRVSVGIHQNDIDAAIETYNLLSEKWFTHASPTLFNAGTCKPQMSSCFLLTMSDDSIDGIYDTLTTCARISKSAGGIGINMHNIRASGSYIAGVRRFNFFQGSSEYLLKVNQSDLRILLSSLLHVHMFEISMCDSSELIILIKGICLNFLHVSISIRPMECQTVLYQCCVFIMQRQDMLTKEETRDQEPLLYTWNPGTQTSLISWT